MVAIHFSEATVFHVMISESSHRIGYTQTAYQLDSTDGGFSDNLEGMLYLCMLLLDRPPWIDPLHSPGDVWMY